MMAILAFCMRLVAVLLQLLPLKRRVVLMSRQSTRMSLDYRLLMPALQKRFGEDKVLDCLIEPESKNMAGFITGTFKQLYYACTSTVIICDDYIPAVCIPRKRRGVTVIQSWHSLGAIKRFGYQAVGTAAGRSEASAKAGHMHENYDYVLAAGPGAVDAYAQGFGYDSQAILPMGLPRMDYLLDPSPASARRKRAKSIASKNTFLTSGKRVVLYAPTLRKGEGYEGWIAGSLRALGNCCPEDKAVLVFAGHPLNNDADEALLHELPCLHIVRGVATIDLLEMANCVITDYSAIAFEAGLLKKNTCFYVPDIEQYQKSPGLNVDLRSSEIGYSSPRATEVMRMALCEQDPAFDAFRSFTDHYFEGIGMGSTQRIVELVESCLS